VAFAQARGGSLRAPCAAIILAVAKPSPFGPAPPVITATLSFSSIASISTVRNGRDVQCALG
jgi:hypothetical protein